MHCARPFSVPRSLLAHGSEENSCAVVSMSGGPSSASSEGLSGEGGSRSAVWWHIYDRIEALLPQVEELAADRARLEVLNRTQRHLSQARENSLCARLVQAEASMTRWKTAYIELPLLANPKIKELQKIDLDDSKNCEALVDKDTSGLEIPLKGARRHAERSETNVRYEDIARDLRAELTKLRKAYETLSRNKDKEATEAAQKLQQNIEELQMAGQNKGVQIGRPRAEAVDAENKEGYETLCANKDKAVSTLLVEKDFVCNQLRATEEDNTALFKIKEVKGAQATEITHTLQKSVEELQVPARNKDDEICRNQAEALAVQNMFLSARDRLDEVHSLATEEDVQKLKDHQLETRRRKHASLPSKSIQIFVNVFYEIITLKVETSDRIDSVKAKIKDKVGLRPCDQLLFNGGQHLKGCCTLADYDIQQKSTLKVLPLRNYIYVHMPSSPHKVLGLVVESSDTIISVKAKIQVQKGFPRSRQLLLRNGSRLRNNRTLADYKIAWGEKFALEVRPQAVRRRVGLDVDAKVIGRDQVPLPCD